MYPNNTFTFTFTQIKATDPQAPKYSPQRFDLPALDLSKPSIPQSDGNQSEHMRAPGFISRHYSFKQDKKALDDHIQEHMLIYQKNLEAAKVEKQVHRNHVHGQLLAYQDAFGGEGNAGDQRLPAKDGEEDELMRRPRAKSGRFVSSRRDMDGRDMDGRDVDGRDMDGRDMDGRDKDGRDMDGRDMDGHDLEIVVEGSHADHEIKREEIRTPPQAPHTDEMPRPDSRDSESGRQTHKDRLTDAVQDLKGRKHVSAEQLAALQREWKWREDESWKKGDKELHDLLDELCGLVHVMKERAVWNDEQPMSAEGALRQPKEQV